MIALDTETTGLDLKHGAAPFFVSTCGEGGEQVYWEFDVVPETREVLIPDGDLEEIREHVLAGEDALILQNAKFDFAALDAIDFWDGVDLVAVWRRVRDTLLDGHLLASNQPHDLTSMVLHYLGADLAPLEKALEDAVKECRRIVQQCRLRIKRRSKVRKDGSTVEITDRDEELARWRIAEDGLEEMPSATDKTWRHDYWLPRAMAKYLWENSEAGKLFELKGYRDYLAQHSGWEYRPPGFAGETGEADLGHPWWTVLAEYSNADSAYTYPLHVAQKARLKERGLERISKARHRLLPIAFGMERRGVTTNGDRLRELREEYREESARAERLCVRIAASLDYELTMPKGGSSNHSLLYFCFGVPNEEPLTPGGVDLPLRLPEAVRPKDSPLFPTPRTQYLDLPVVWRTETGAPSLAKEAMETYEVVLPPNSKQLTFVHALKRKRKHDTGVSYMDSYERFWLPHAGADRDLAVSRLRANRGRPVWVEGGEAGWYVLHPSINPTGTDTLRWSSSNPNSQNISKQEIYCDRCGGDGCPACDGKGKKKNVRFVFGPAPGREWWSLDAKNIELRIPFYESGEEEMIALFEKPDEPPYYGSNHLLNFHTVYPDIWTRDLGKVCKESCCKGRVTDFLLIGPHCKKKYAASWYQYCKNGGFAKQYGGQKAKVDATFRVPGAYELLAVRFSKLEKLNQKYIKFAERHGYVETLPSKFIDPDRGYPIMCARSEYGKIEPTKPLNYHVQSSAMEWTGSAMVRCEEQLNDWGRRVRFDAWIAIQQHDELVFDLPRRGNPLEDLEREKVGDWAGMKSNLPRVRVLQKLMEKGGGDIGIPTPVGVEYHQANWGEGITIS